MSKNDEILTPVIVIDNGKLLIMKIGKISFKSFFTLHCQLRSLSYGDVIYHEYFYDVYFLAMSVLL